VLANFAHRSESRLRKKNIEGSSSTSFSTRCLAVFPLFRPICSLRRCSGRSTPSPTGLSLFPYDTCSFLLTLAPPPLICTFPPFFPPFGCAGRLYALPSPPRAAFSPRSPLCQSSLLQGFVGVAFRRFLPPSLFFVMIYVPPLHNDCCPLLFIPFSPSLPRFVIKCAAGCPTPYRIVLFFFFDGLFGYALRMSSATPDVSLFVLDPRYYAPCRLQFFSGDPPKSAPVSPPHFSPRFKRSSGGVCSPNSYPCSAEG